MKTINPCFTTYKCNLVCNIKIHIVDSLSDTAARYVKMKSYLKAAAILGLHYVLIRYPITSYFLCKKLHLKAAA